MASPEDHDLAAVLDLVWQEEAPHLQLHEVDGGEVLGGAEDGERLRPGVAVEHPLLLAAGAPPSQTSMIATDGHSRAIAFASSIDKFGRLAISRNVLPDEALIRPNFCTMMVFGPSSRNRSRSDSSKPRISDVMPTIEVMPMTTPSTVSADRILLARSVSKDIATISPSTRCAVPPSPTPASTRRSDPARRAHRRIEPEEQADDAVMPMPMPTDQTAPRPAAASAC